jgi:hypothetical protein
MGDHDDLEDFSSDNKLGVFRFRSNKLLVIKLSTYRDHGLMRLICRFLDLVISLLYQKLYLLMSPPVGLSAIVTL